MKIRVVSDLHLEFGGLLVTNEKEDDLLILSGDIIVGSVLRPERRNHPENLSHHEKVEAERFHDFFTMVSKEFKNVIMVPGNHEYYHGDISRENHTIRDFLAQFDNVHFLLNESIVIDGIRFIGTPLWTDFNGGDPISMLKAESLMNDYHIIWDEESCFLNKQSSAKLHPNRTLELHRESLDTISKIYESSSEDSIVVIGHHAPSRQSTHPKYIHDRDLNGAYSTNLDGFIEKHERIKLWTHGHTHHSFDYMIGKTRVVCNPRGYYLREENCEFDPNLSVEVL
jgi:predicted phosphodiesterase